MHRMVLAVSVAAILVGAPILSWALTYRVTWTNPTENVDGSPLTDLKQILLCVNYDTEPPAGQDPYKNNTNCDAVVAIPTTTPGKAMEYVYEATPPAGNVSGTAYFRAIAVDTSLNRSEYTPAVSIGYDVSIPAPPANLAIVPVP